MTFNLEKQPKVILNESKEPDNKKCWEIKSIKDDVVYKIWAETYEQALKLLPMIESF